MTASSIILICHDAPFGRAMAAALANRFGPQFVGVLAINRPTSRRKVLKNRLIQIMRRYTLAGQVRRIEATLTAAADRVFQSEAKPPQGWPANVKVLKTENPNNAASVDWLKAQAPDILAVTGAPILREPVFGLPRLGTLNMHSSLLPAYRGTQAEFWQVLDRRLDTAGLTIHFVDAGVDTGRIVLQRATDVDADVSPQMLRARNLIAALKVVPDAIASVLDGTAQPQPQGQGAAAKLSKDRTVEVRAQLLAGLGYGNFGSSKGQRSNETKA